MSVPVLFITFNRPIETLRVLKKIKQYAPKKIYISSDGPRKDKFKEDTKVYNLRNNFKKLIDWDCQVYYLFNDSNFGCKHAVSAAIKWFFENEEMGIILEDDCLPSIDFFKFCEITLERYMDDEKIFHIGGTNFGKPSNNNLLHFSKYPLIWGWASWRRAWNYYDVDMLDYPLKRKSNFLKVIFSKNEIEYWISNLDKAYNNEIDTWDYQWFYTIWNNQALTILPDINLIKNIGFNPNATHTTESNKLFNNMKSGSLNFKVPIPTDIKINDKLDEEISYEGFNIGKSKVKRFIERICYERFNIGKWIIRRFVKKFS